MSYKKNLPVLFLKDRSYKRKIPDLKNLHVYKNRFFIRPLSYEPERGKLLNKSCEMLGYIFLLKF